MLFERFIFSFRFFRDNLKGFSMVYRWSIGCCGVFEGLQVSFTGFEYICCC